MTGKQLQKWRESRNYTREQLARLLQTTYTTIYRWETGQRSIPPYLEWALKSIPPNK